jgi:hypothetical protein
VPLMLTCCAVVRACSSRGDPAQRTHRAIRYNLRVLAELMASTLLLCVVWPLQA